MAYLHGTSVSVYDAPSNPNVFGELSENGESFDGPPSSALFAGGGFIYVAPDYLGLGDSTVPRHRYFHAATEASSAVDLLGASREVLTSLRVHRSGELFTFGFSQGGHAALALHRVLDHRRVDVTATATVGGVLDVERFFLSSIADETTVTLPLYVSYILLAYDDVYNVYQRPADVFRRTYASSVPGLFDCGTSSTTCSRACRRPRASSSGRRTSGPCATTRMTRSASVCVRTRSTAGDPMRRSGSTTPRTTRRCSSRTCSYRWADSGTEARTSP